VCTTELAAFAQAHPRFQALGCDLLGLSIDSTHAHIAWMRSIEANLGVKVEFPIIEDLSMEVSRAYGMLQPGASDTTAVRTLYPVRVTGTFEVRRGRAAGGDALYRIVGARAKVLTLESD
jgi:peroxiredoxin (alkyl hydroperoxide reductase subunit C)